MGFLAGALAAYALKKVKIAVVIVGMFIAALAYLEYHRTIEVDWTSLQAVSQGKIICLTNVAYKCSLI